MLFPSRRRTRRGWRRRRRDEAELVMSWHDGHHTDFLEVGRRAWSDSNAAFVKKGEEEVERMDFDTICIMDPEGNDLEWRRQSRRGD